GPDRARLSGEDNPPAGVTLVVDRDALEVRDRGRRQLVIEVRSSHQRSDETKERQPVVACAKRMARVLDVAHDAVAGPNRRRRSPILRGAGAREHEQDLLRSGVALLDGLAGRELEAAQADVQSSSCLTK